MAAEPVPFLDLGATYRELSDEFDSAYHRVMQSGWYLLGDELEQFESEFCLSTGATFAVGVGSGLDALVLTLRALDVGVGDEVIVPSNTYVATWMAVTAVGATIVPVEPDPTTSIITAKASAAALTSRTKVLLPVHLYGLPVDLDDFERLAERHGLALVADAAQAHDSSWRGAPVGGRGRAACWSFYPGKNLGAFGDAGAVTTDDAELAARVRRLRNYGSEQKYHNIELGTNSRLDELQAAFLRVKLTALPAWTTRRRRIAATYARELPTSERLALPVETDGADSAWHLYVVRTAERDALQAHLAAATIGTLIHYPIPPHRQLAYAADPIADARLPIADDLARTVLSLPIGPHLSDPQVDRVIAAVRSFT